jgi:putative transposase
VLLQRRVFQHNPPIPDAGSVLRQLPLWLAHYNELHPHRALGYRSPREFIARSAQESLSGQ